MSLVFPVFYTKVTVSIGLKNVYLTILKRIKKFSFDIKLELR